MRKILSAIIILVIIVGAVPPILGHFAQENFATTLTNLMQSSPEHRLFKITFDECQKGWLTSKCRLSAVSSNKQISMLFNDPSNPAHIDLTLHNGPFVQMVSATGIKSWTLGMGVLHADLRFSEPAEMMISSVLHANINAYGDMLNRFDGSYQMALRVDPINYENKQQQMAVSWGGVSAFTDLAPKLSNMTSKGTFAAISMKSPRGNFEMAPISLSSVLVRDPHYYFDVGSGAGLLPNAKFSVANNTIVNVNNFNISSDTDITNNLFNYQLNMAVDKVNVINLGDYSGQMSLGLKHVDASALRQLYDKLIDLQLTNATPQEVDAMAFQNIGLAKDLLSKQIQISLKGKLNTAQGNIDSSMLATLGVPGSDANPIEAFKPVLTKASLDFAMTISKTLADEILAAMARDSAHNKNDLAQANGGVIQTPMQLEQGARQQVENTIAELHKNGFLALDGDHYKFHMLYQNDQLKVNDKDIPLTQLLQSGATPAVAPEAAKAAAPEVPKATAPKSEDAEDSDNSEDSKDNAKDEDEEDTSSE